MRSRKHLAQHDSRGTTRVATIRARRQQAVEFLCAETFARRDRAQPREGARDADDRVRLVHRLLCSRCEMPLHETIVRDDRGKRAPQRTSRRVDHECSTTVGRARGVPRVEHARLIEQSHEQRTARDIETRFRGDDFGRRSHTTREHGRERSRLEFDIPVEEEARKRIESARAQRFFGEIHRFGFAWRCRLDHDDARFKRARARSGVVDTRVGNDDHREIGDLLRQHCAQCALDSLCFVVGGDHHRRHWINSRF